MHTREGFDKMGFKWNYGIFLSNSKILLKEFTSSGEGDGGDRYMYIVSSLTGSGILRLKVSRGAGSIELDEVSEAQLEYLSAKTYEKPLVLDVSISVLVRMKCMDGARYERFISWMRGLRTCGLYINTFNPFVDKEVYLSHFSDVFMDVFNAIGHHPFEDEKKEKKEKKKLRPFRFHMFCDEVSTLSSVKEDAIESAIDFINRTDVGDLVFSLMKGEIDEEKHWIGTLRQAIDIPPHLRPMKLISKTKNAAKCT